MPKLQKTEDVSLVGVLLKTARETMQDRAKQAGEKFGGAWTMQQLGRAIGIDQAYWHRLESGKTKRLTLTHVRAAEQFRVGRDVVEGLVAGVMPDGTPATPDAVRLWARAHLIAELSNEGGREWLLKTPSMPLTVNELYEEAKKKRGKAREMAETIYEGARKNLEALLK